MILWIRKWFTRNFTHLLWYPAHKNQPTRPCLIMIYNKERETGTTYNFNGKDWRLGKEFVWTHAPLTYEDHVHVGRRNKFAF